LKEVRGELVDNIILEIGLALGLISFAIALANKLGVSNIPFLILIGIAVGPHAPQFGAFDFRFIETGSLISFMGRIGVLFLEWSGFGNQKVVIDWMLIDGPKTAQAFGDRLLESPRSFADRTSISGGIDAAVAQLARAPFSSERRTIDVSGDGTNNAGRDVGQARDEALELGISINGLVILSETPLPWNPEHTNPPGGLTKYYRDNVTGGPGSFVLEAKDFDSFGEAIVKKMIAEIADAGREGASFAR